MEKNKKTFILVGGLVLLGIMWVIFSKQQSLNEHSLCSQYTAADINTQVPIDNKVLAEHDDATGSKLIATTGEGGSLPDAIIGAYCSKNPNQPIDSVWNSFQP